MKLPPETAPLPGSAGMHHPLNRLTDPFENYGTHVVERLVRSLTDVQTVVDIGAGSGRDLAIVHRIHPAAKLIAVEGGMEYAQNLVGKVDEIHVANIERDILPFASNSVDLFIANQVLEHTKEVFWIFSEISRCLKIGGRFLFGVPNVCSLHNRLLMLLGRQPSSSRMCSAHVRPFSKNDTLAFLDACFPGGYELEAFRGSQFYPFPVPVARILAGSFPAAAVTIFFLIRKTAEYRGEFATYPIRAQLETNYWSGTDAANSQYWAPSEKQPARHE